MKLTGLVSRVEIDGGCYKYDEKECGHDCTIQLSNRVGVKEKLRKSEVDALIKGIDPEKIVNRGEYTHRVSRGKLTSEDVLQDVFKFICTVGS